MKENRAADELTREHHGIQNKPRTALITGASSGIGAAFANAYAQKNCTLILHAPAWEEAALTTLAADLKNQYSVETHIIIADLTDSRAPLAIFDDVAALDIPVDILVNNAGVVHYASFLAAGWKQHEHFLYIMLHAACHMTHLFAPAMAERGYGRIINVASITGLMPGLPGGSFYSASKAFLIKFSESIAVELALDGVHVTALCPGMTRTNLFAAAEVKKIVSNIPALFWMDTDRVAQEGVKAVEDNIPIYINGYINRLTIKIINAIPKRLVRNFAVKRERRKRAKAQRIHQPPGRK